jgi:hypothetical protein
MSHRKRRWTEAAGFGGDSRRRPARTGSTSMVLALPYRRSSTGKVLRWSELGLMAVDRRTDACATSSLVCERLSSDETTEATGGTGAAWRRRDRGGASFLWEDGCNQSAGRRSFASAVAYRLLVTAE